MSRTCSRCDCEIDPEGGCGCNPTDAEYEQRPKRRMTWKQLLSSPATGSTQLADEGGVARKEK